MDTAISVNKTADQEVVATEQRKRERSVVTRMLAVFGAHSVGNLVTLCDRFLLLPIMLYFWGAELTGIWLTLRTVPAVLSVGELGFASAAGNRMTIYLASHEFSQAARVYWGTARMIGVITLVALGVNIAVLAFTPIQSWLKCETLSSFDFVLAVLAVAAYTVLVFQTQLYYAAYRSINMQAFAVFSIHLVRVAELALAVLAIFLWPSVIAVSMAYMIARALGVVAIRRNLFKQANWLCEHRSTDWGTSRELLKPALGFAAIPISQSLQLQGSALAVAIAAGPETVAAFTAMRTLARFPIQFCSSLGRTAWPEFSQAFAARDMKGLLALHQRVMAISLLLSVLSVAALIFAGPWVFQLWTGNKLEFSMAAFVMLAFGSGVCALGSNALTLLNALSLHLRTARAWFLITIVTVAALLLVTGSLDILGVAIALAVSEVLMLLWVLLDTRAQVRFLKSNQTGEFARQ